MHTHYSIQRQGGLISAVLLYIWFLYPNITALFLVLISEYYSIISGSYIRILQHYFWFLYQNITALYLVFLLEYYSIISGSFIRILQHYIWFLLEYYQRED